MCPVPGSPPAPLLCPAHPLMDSGATGSAAGSASGHRPGRRGLPVLGGGGHRQTTSCSEVFRDEASLAGVAGAPRARRAGPQRLGKGTPPSACLHA